MNFDYDSRISRSKPHPEYIQVHPASNSTLQQDQMKPRLYFFFFFFLIILHGKKSKQELMFSEWGTEETSLLQNRT